MLDIIMGMATGLLGVVILPQLKDCLKGASVNVFSAGLTTTLVTIITIGFILQGMYVTAIGESLAVIVWFLITTLSWRNLRRYKQLCLED